MRHNGSFVRAQMQQAIAALVHGLQTEIVLRLDLQQHAQARHVAVDRARHLAKLAAPDHREDVIARQHAADIRKEQRRELVLRAGYLSSLSAPLICR